MPQIVSTKIPNSASGIISSKSSKRSKEFEVLYESIVVNYSSTEREEVEYQRPAILYVLPALQIVSQSLLPRLKPFK